jgi:predicted restriction endonuclease
MRPLCWCPSNPGNSKAHHIAQWARDHGTTNISNGILLCRYHHMLLHNNGWEIIRDTTEKYWLKPPKEQDPHQTLIEMPTKNPLIAAMKHAHAS